MEKSGLVWERIKTDENGRKFSKSVKNTVVKGAIACYMQFLLFLQCFQKTCTQTLNPLTDFKILDWSKLKQIANENLK